MTSTSRIHPTAIIDPSATIGEEVEVGPYAVIEAQASIGTGSCIEAHAIVRKYSFLGDRVSVDSFAVVGGQPQDLSFDESVESRVRIGAGSVLREGVSIHRSTGAGGETVVGENCLLMANSHVAHDCSIGNGVILANNVMLAGHVHVGGRSFLGGGCGIHQFVRIGDMVMVAGNASITYDVPSYTMAAERSLITGLNLVGMKRNLAREAVSDLRSLYKAVYMKAGNPAKLAEGLEAATEDGRKFLSDFKNTRRGRFSLSRTQSS